jgi:hypothetical protein
MEIGPKRNVTSNQVKFRSSSANRTPMGQSKRPQRNNNEAYRKIANPVTARASLVKPFETINKDDSDSDSDSDSDHESSLPTQDDHDPEVDSHEGSTTCLIAAAEYDQEQYIDKVPTYAEARIGQATGTTHRICIDTGSDTHHY